ncbi:hypothetical protein ALNOE001_20830 [Candidatus Methanobinarius endosymbioticus]|uniref:KTSC domain-containing protein n=1 Tax=Candidatus Methanobinarius endosymbioticus TaxID=2006182 RepID=A0A366M9D7_9EURY|nr:hypothetical protein ALNOE001_20830 [Candidatus Methanobinarius endosymbioticus]
MDFSNNIAFQRVYYNHESKTLFVIFRNGHRTKYAHENVPEDVYNDFKASEFSNRYYYQNIKDKYNKKIDFWTDEDHKHLNFPEYD